MAGVSDIETGSAGFGSREARWGLIILWLGGIIAATDGGYGPDAVTAALYVSALIVDLGALLLVTEQSPRILSPPRAAATTLCVVLAAALGLVAYARGAEVWVVANAVTAAALLFARGNPRWGVVAVAGTAVPAATAAATGLLAPADAVYVLGVAGLLVPCAALWRPGVRGILRREQWHRTQESRAELEAEASALAAREHTRQLRRVRRDAAPLLERLATAPSLDADDLAELAVVEGAIRDRMRSPLARDDALIDAIARARRRGVRVLLLWDGDPAGTPHPGLVASLTAIVEDARTGSLVIRGGDGRGEMSVMRTGEGAVSRIVLDDAGATISVR